MPNGIPGYRNVVDTVHASRSTTVMLFASGCVMNATGFFGESASPAGDGVERTRVLSTVSVSLSIADSVAEPWLKT
jgi:hypothetical protein